MSEKTKYLEQFERMNRWFKHFEEIDQGKEHTLSSDFYKDEMFAFFMNCYHLKDWIKNDDSVSSEITQTVEKYINQNQCLKYCADIANGSKHLKLINPPRSGKKIDKMQSHYKINVGSGPEIVRVKYTFTMDDGIELDAFDLAKDCVKKWNDFFEDNNMKLE